jgi:hypothetical protein
VDAAAAIPGSTNRPTISQSFTASDKSGRLTRKKTRITAANAEQANATIPSGVGWSTTAGIMQQRSSQHHEVHRLHLR